MNYTALHLTSKNSKFMKIIMGLTIFLLIVVAGLALYVYLNPLTKTRSAQKACTLEAKVCSDGSSVSRAGPNCEFAKCP